MPVPQNTEENLNHLIEHVVSRMDTEELREAVREYMVLEMVDNDDVFEKTWENVFGQAPDR